MRAVRARKQRGSYSEWVPVGMPKHYVPTLVENELLKGQRNYAVAHLRSEISKAVEEALVSAKLHEEQAVARATQAAMSEKAHALGVVEAEITKALEKMAAAEVRASQAERATEKEALAARQARSEAETARLAERKVIDAHKEALQRIEFDQQVAVEAALEAERAATSGRIEELTRQKERGEDAAVRLKAAYDGLEAAKQQAEARAAEAVAGAASMADALQAAEKKAEREAAAAKSMEASYDVAMEQVQDLQAKVDQAQAEAAKATAALRRQEEEGGEALQAAQKKAEREAAAAKSMEASYDVAMEQVQDLQTKLAKLQAGREE